MPEETILWRRLDQPGHEVARLVFHAPFWQLAGMAVFGAGGGYCGLEYLVVCDAKWQTLHARVSGWHGGQRIRLELAAAGRRWQLNRRECPDAAGCIDLDLAFSPATNLLPIRRLALEVGQEAVVRAAWLTFPQLSLEPLDQVYRRTGPDSYRYEAAGIGFATELRVNTAGFVTHYPGLSELEVSA